jgi:2,4-dienoyl-CoA reductase-like NADH-dependent reductase (Old Yellow Enzyme family)
MSRDQAWTKIAEGISRKGSVPGIQLACKLPGLLLAKKWINRDAIASATRWRERICGMSRDELGAIVSGFREAAEMALNHGFRVLQIHAAHGYFLSQMLSPTINKRDDFYGANRARILEEVIESIDCVRTDALIDVRISLASRLEDDYESELCLRATIESIYARNVDMISLSNGMYEVNRFDIYPRLKDGNACYLEPSIELSRQFPNILWNVAGNINDLADFARRATHNLSASIGRSLIADPEFVNRQVAGDGYQPCLRCGHCHYYSRGKLHLECGVNRLIQGSDAFDPL